MKTRGEIEDGICAGMIRFEQEYMGRGPKHIDAHLVGNMLIVRMHDVLTAAEKHLVTTRPPEDGRELVQRMRAKLLEAARPALDLLAESVCGVKPVTTHHHVCTASGEEIVVFSLSTTPTVRDKPNHRP
ncbi:MAG: DUF2294 domain-containing protein [Phycisphaeraceae bacterium]|nr:DUF2294 domain-containing protein [Phycisphaeraceae bacterium]